MINWTEVIVGICSMVITGIMVPLITAKKKEVKNRLTDDQLATVEYWTEIGVRWAKQWLWSESGQNKKTEVTEFLNKKLAELNLSMTAEDIDKIIEAIYERIKTDDEQH